MFFGLSWRYLIAYFGGLVSVVLLTASSIAARRWLRRRRPKQLWLANAAIGLLLTVFVLFLFEGYFAFFYDTTDAWGLLNTTRLWMNRHAPTSNNLSSRGRKFVDPTKAPNVNRIVFLGDSFTWGHGVAREEDRFSNLIESAFKSFESSSAAGWTENHGVSEHFVFGGGYRRRTEHLASLARTRFSDGHGRLGLLLE